MKLSLGKVLSKSEQKLILGGGGLPDGGTGCEGPHHLHLYDYDCTCVYEDDCYFGYSCITQYNGQKVCA